VRGLQVLPAIRALARKLDVDLNLVQGNGPSGMITRADVERAARSLTEAGPAEPLKGMRRAMPPWWIRGILILTCTLVSFFHGSNDGQKGMGLIMLILIGTVPTAYALNRAMPESEMQTFAATSQAASAVIDRLNRLPSDRPRRLMGVLAFKLPCGRCQL
jgi:pyruvate/2-oxoglutarate dehydrogenase complex dihydrolipoamide acyltransferase (E2) component